MYSCKKATESELIDSFIVDKTKQEENIPEIENNDLKSSIISKLNQR